MKKTNSFARWVPWALGFGLFVFVTILYLHLGRDYLFDWDEGIYGELARELVVSKNFLVTFWNGTPWFEKPPGVAWVSALGIALAGPSAFGARLFFPLIAGYTIWAMYQLGKARGGTQQGVLAAALLATFSLFLSRTRGVNADMPLLAAIITTAWFLVAHRPAWQVALAIALGIWFKGPAGLLTVLISVPLLIGKPKEYLLCLVSYFLLLTIPWHLYVYVRYGEQFLTPYLYEQVLRRATAQIEFHFENRWYYFTYLFQNLGLGPLIVAAVGALKLIWQTRGGQSKRLATLAESLLPLWWTMVPLTIFTLAKTRLFWYILPTYPGIALLMTEAITAWNASPRARRVVGLLTVGIMIQALVAATRSVEITKKTALPADRIAAVMTLASRGVHTPLSILVPESERRAQALLPAVATLSSSFRYGGMPAVVFYYRAPVKFYYNVDEFILDFGQQGTYALLERADLARLPKPYQLVVETGSVVAVSREVYAQR